MSHAENTLLLGLVASAVLGFLRNHFLDGSEAEHEEVTKILLRFTEGLVGSMKTVQHTENSKAVVESV